MTNHVDNTTQFSIVDDRTSNNVQTINDVSTATPRSRKSLFVSEHSYSKPIVRKVKRKLEKPTTSKNVVFNPIIPIISKFVCDAEEEQNKNVFLEEKEKRDLIKSVLTGKVHVISESVIRINSVQKSVIKGISNNINKNIDQLGHRKHHFVSELMKKEPSDLKHFNWASLVNEMMCLFPSIFQIIIGVLLRPSEARSYQKVQKVMPKIGMMYGVLLQGRNPELSIVQRMMSMILMDNICDQKVNMLILIRIS